jgi:ferredoxin
LATGGFRIEVNGANHPLSALPGQTLLACMIASGATMLKVGCRNGGCGVCRVRVIEGDYRALPMNRARISAEDQESNIALACRIVPLGNLRVAAMPLES